MGNTARKSDGREIRYRRLVEEAPEVMMVLGPDLEVRYASRAVGRTLGLDPHRVAGNPFSAYLHPKDVAWTRDLCMASGRGAKRSSREIRVRHADGSWLWFEAVAADLLDDPDVRGVAIYLHDVTGGRKLRDQLAHRAFHDPLTGLPNRALFEDRLKHALARTERHRVLVTVLFVDLDDFKAVNDRFGHEVGDKLLAAVGRRLEETLRPGDTVARLGGDEFAVLIEDGGEALAATRTMERLAHALRQPIAVEGRTMFVTSSVGGAAGANGTDGVEDLIRKADAAMYRAKRAGKDRFELFDGEDAKDVRGSLWFEHDLEGMMEREELEVHFQPEVDLGNGRIAGMEALLRWKHPLRVSPAEIVASAEMSGLIGAVGRQVLEKACRHGSFWQRRYPEDPPLVSVNLSAKQLHEPSLVDDVASALRVSGLDPANLALEVSEGCWAEEATHVALTIQKLQSLGVKLVADDFGRGSCSLSYLSRFRVDLLKIGRSFVGRLGRGEEDVAKLVQAMIGFAQAMGIRAVASGVETAEQADILHKNGCEQAQGFYFFEPVPADAATRILDSDRRVGQMLLYNGAAVAKGVH